MASTGNARKFCCIHFRAVFFLHRDSHAELASHHIEVLILERQRQGIGLPSPDPAIKRLPRRGVIEHRLIEIGCGHAHVIGSRDAITREVDQRPDGLLIGSGQKRTVQPFVEHDFSEARWWITRP
jgi:hypothetical protein